MTDTRHQLRLNGWATDDSGRVICFREPAYRYAHEQVGVIKINAPKEFAAKIVAALDEPAALVYVAGDCTLVLFRVTRRDTMPQKLNFHVEGNQCSLVATSESGALNSKGGTWAHGRSPLTVRLNDLPPLFVDHVENATRAVSELGGKVGILAEQIAADKATAERLAKIQEEIAAGYWTDEAVQAREDDEIVARYQGAEISTSYPTTHEMQVIAARRRVAARKRLAGENAIADTAA